MKEKVIDGILHFQVRQNSDFVEGCPAEITRRYLDTKKEMIITRRRLKETAEKLAKAEARLEWWITDRDPVGGKLYFVTILGPDGMRWVSEKLYKGNGKGWDIPKVLCWKITAWMQKPEPFGGEG